VRYRTALRPDPRVLCPNDPEHKGKNYTFDGKLIATPIMGSGSYEEAPQSNHPLDGKGDHTAGDEDTDRD
jgi:hypothetical protein